MHKIVSYEKPFSVWNCVAKLNKIFSRAIKNMKFFKQNVRFLLIMEIFKPRK